MDPGRLFLATHTGKNTPFWHCFALNILVTSQIMDIHVAKCIETSKKCCLNIALALAGLKAITTGPCKLRRDRFEFRLDILASIALPRMSGRSQSNPRVSDGWILLESALSHLKTSNFITWPISIPHSNSRLRFYTFCPHDGLTRYPKTVSKLPIP